jgi:hypothetical protein
MIFFTSNMDAAIWCGSARLVVRQAPVIPLPLPFGVVGLCDTFAIRWFAGSGRKNQPDPAILAES